MQKGWIIFNHELYTIFGRPSFWIAAFFVPVLTLCLYAGVLWFSQKQGGEHEDITDTFQEILTPKEENRPQGYVDLSGVIRQTPPGFKEENLLPYPDETSARRALAEGKIGAYYVITADFLKTGLVYNYFEKMNSSFLTGRNPQLTELVNYNLLEGNQAAGNWISEPIREVRETDLSPDQGKRLLDPKGGLNQQAIMLPYMTGYMVSLVILGVSGLLLTAVNREHENRTLESLLTSTTPYPFLLAKMAALGLAGLVQVASLGLSFLFTAQWGGQAFSMPELSAFSPEVLVWSLALCLAGYLFYGALMISIGVLVSGVRDHAQIASIAALPLMIPTLLTMSISKDPNGPLATWLSYIPFTSASAMPARMMVVRLPAWQPVLALVLLIVSFLIGMRITAGLFKSQRLMGGSQFYFANWFKWLRKKKDRMLDA